MGSQLGLVDTVSQHWGWMRWQVWSAASIWVRQYSNRLRRSVPAKHYAWYLTPGRTLSNHCHIIIYLQQAVGWGFYMVGANCFPTCWARGFQTVKSQLIIRCPLGNRGSSSVRFSSVTLLLGDGVTAWDLARKQVRSATPVSVSVQFLPKTVASQGHCKPPPYQLRSAVSYQAIPTAA